jgi:hypothetical protein
MVKKEQIDQWRKKREEIHQMDWDDREGLRIAKNLPSDPERALYQLDYARKIVERRLLYTAALSKKPGERP